MIPRVSGVFASQAGDNDSLKDSERKRPDHQALAQEFSARLAASPATESSASQDRPATEETILTYEYDPAKGRITLQKINL